MTPSHQPKTPSAAEPLSDQMAAVEHAREAASVLTTESPAHWKYAAHDVEMAMRFHPGIPESDLEVAAAAISPRASASPSPTSHLSSDTSPHGPAFGERLEGLLAAAEAIRSHHPGSVAHTRAQERVVSAGKAQLLARIAARQGSSKHADAEPAPVVPASLRVGVGPRGKVGRAFWEPEPTRWNPEHRLTDRGRQQHITPRPPEPVSPSSLHHPSVRTARLRKAPIRDH